MKHFSHGGDLGDTIYALPILKYWYDTFDEQTIFFYKERSDTRCRFNAEHAAKIISLLKLQPYIADVLPYDPSISCIDGDHWRQHYRNVNVSLTLAQATEQKLGPQIFHLPWLYNIEPKLVSRIILHKSVRYPGMLNWPNYRKQAVLIGQKDEHVAFEKKFGKVDFYETPNLLEVARVIQAADIFVGNQSCPLAIAYGLGKKIIVEECPNNRNCNLGRHNVLLK